jgi:hypothetical protein
MNPTGDVVKWLHHIYWRLKIVESGSVEFQQLFEKIMERAGDQFVRVKPHGRLGDRKCDGLYFGDGVVYQVYSPDRVRLNTTLAKIEEDLAGAVAEWGDALKQWVFVYNTRGGIAADVPLLLKQQQMKYPNIKISPFGDADLWKLVRDLPVQDRVEILGPPPGLEELFPALATLPAEVRERLRTGRFVVVQDMMMSPVNMHDAIDAMRPETPIAPPLVLREKAADQLWELAAAQQHSLVDEALDLGRERLPRFATFGFAPIPLAVHLGYLLSDRVEVCSYQWDRERHTWAWDPRVTAGDTSFMVTGLDGPVLDAPAEVILRVSLSACVTPEQTKGYISGTAVEVEIAVAKPHPVTWLVHPDQVPAFRRALRDTLARIREQVPHCTRIHLFAAVPMPCAVATGQAINPRMNAPVQLYQFDRREEPAYRPALLLG